MSEDWQARLGALIRRYREPVLTQAALAMLVSEKSGRHVAQATVSEHENGKRWTKDFDLAHVYAEVLGIPLEEVHDAIGLPKVDHAPRPKSFAEIVAQDKTLSKAAKDHLLNQYELLQMATQHQRAGKPVLHEDKAPSRRKPA